MKNMVSISLLCMLCAVSAFALAETGTTIQVDGSAMEAIVQQRTRNLQVYAHQVNEIVAAKVREVRVEQESAAMQKAGHPVALPTGSCRAVVTVKADGTVMHAELAGCSSDELGKVEMEAIRRASPLPPSGAAANVTVSTLAPVATPGVYGN